MNTNNLEFLLARAEELAKVAQPHPEEVAGVALALAAAHTAILEALEPLKDKLREHARLLLPEGEVEGIIEVPGLLGPPNGDWVEAGTVSVTFPYRKLKLSGDPDRLKNLLGLSFKDYFEETSSYRPVRDFQERVKARQPFNPEECRIVLGAVELVEPTPRVGFKPSGDVEPGEAPRKEAL